VQVNGGKIERIELFHIEVPLPTPLFPVWIPGYPQYKQCATLLAVTTKDGLTGYASAPAFERERTSLGEFIGKFLLGLDPYDLDLVRERIRQAAYLGWRNSWMDLAFWDLAAQARGIPLHALIAERLGAPERDVEARVPVYASFPELRPPRVRAEAVERAQSLGFAGVKIAVHSSRESDDFEQVAMSRKVAGDDLAIMVHARQAWSVSLVEESPRWDLDRARRFAGVAETCNVRWLQEPLHDEAWESLAQLGAATRMPIAGGDMSFGFAALDALTRAQCYRILTPDAAFFGLGNQVRTMKSCLDRKLSFAPSSNSDGIGLVANLHALAAWRRFSEDEHAVLEFPWEPPAMIPEYRDALLERPLHIAKDSTLEVPTAPGLGVAIDPAALKRYGERFYHVTPVRFAVKVARSGGLRTTHEAVGKRPRRRPESTVRDKSRLG
jgi:D-galactarolactone cycloisomerase